MGFTSIWHWVIVLIIVLLLFGAGKIPRLMGDLAKGVKAFKSGLKDDETTADGDGQKQLKSDPAAQPQKTVVVDKDEPAKH